MSNKLNHAWLALCHGPLGRFFRDQHGNMIVGVVVAVIIGIAAIGIGAAVYGGIEDGMPAVSNQKANETITAVFDGGWSAYGMLRVLPVILAASAIFVGLYSFGVIGGAGGGRR